MLIARALAQGADHLILDEPTNHLDIRYQIEVLELVAGLESPCWPPCTTSAWPPCSATPSTCSTDGRIVAGGPPGHVITAETVRHAYGADVLVVDHPETGTPHLIPRRPRPAAAAPTASPARRLRADRPGVAERRQP